MYMFVTNKKLLYYHNGDGLKFWSLGSYIWICIVNRNGTKKTRKERERQKKIEMWREKQSGKKNRSRKGKTQKMGDSAFLMMERLTWCFLLMFYLLVITLSLSSRLSTTLESFKVKYSTARTTALQKSLQTNGSLLLELDLQVFICILISSFSPACTTYYVLYTSSTKKTVYSEFRILDTGNLQCKFLFCCPFLCINY